MTDTRTDEVYQLLCTGLNRAGIIAYAQENEWAADEVVIDRLIDAAIQDLAAAAGFNYDAELGKSIERLNRLFQKAFKVEDLKTALATQKEINKLLQLKGVDENRNRVTQPKLKRMRLVK